MSMFNDLHLLKAQEVIIDNWVDEISEKYNLIQILDDFNLVNDPEETNEKTCTRVIRRMSWKATFVPSEEIKLPDFKKMYMSIYSNVHKPDVAIYIGSKLVLVIEVISCSGKFSFGNTIRKLILGLLDLIRYYSFFDSTVRTLHGFVFPKRESNGCVVLVTLEFRDFTFWYHLKAIPRAHIKEELRVVYELNKKILGNFKVGDGAIGKYYIKLSGDEMNIYGRNCKQIEAKEAIMFYCEGQYYKIPVTKKDNSNLSWYSFAILGCNDTFQHFIKLQKSGCFYTYKAVKYDPLTTSQARECLGDLVSQIHKALSKLHAIMCHLDIRLENICFQEDYSLMFIDVDRSTITENVSDDCLYPGSCMYKAGFDKLLDWLQLGCLVLWCITATPASSGEDYHKQTLCVDHPIVKNKFLLNLWNICGIKVLYI